MRPAQSLDTLDDDARQVKNGPRALEGADQKKYSGIAHLRSQAGGPAGAVRIPGPRENGLGERPACGLERPARKKLPCVAGRRDAGGAMPRESGRIGQAGGLARPRMPGGRRTANGVPGRLRLRHRGSLARKIRCGPGTGSAERHGSAQPCSPGCQLIPNARAPPRRSFGKPDADAVPAKAGPALGRRPAVLRGRRAGAGRRRPAWPATCRCRRMPTRRRRHGMACRTACHGPAAPCGAGTLR